MSRKRKGHTDCRVYVIHAMLGERKRDICDKKKEILQVAWVGRFTKHITLANRRNAH